MHGGRGIHKWRPSKGIDLWLNNLQIRRKMHPPWWQFHVQRRKVQFQAASFPRDNFSLSSISGQKDLVSLSNLASLGQTTATLGPSSLRSRKVKSCLSESKVRLHLYSVSGHEFVIQREYIFLKYLGSCVLMDTFIEGYKLHVQMWNSEDLRMHTSYSSL